MHSLHLSLPLRLSLLQVITVGDEAKALFDHVYECQLSGASVDSTIFSEHAKPLVEGLLGGVNATIVAYGEVSDPPAEAWRSEETSTVCSF